MEEFVGRAAELAEIRDRIAEKLPTVGYVTITGQAGQGKSSVIARLVADALGDQASLRERLLSPGAGVPICHFIPFSPGPDHQVGLLRNLIARLCLTYDLPDFYVASDSRPALRDYFAAALRDLAKQGKQEIIIHRRPRPDRGGHQRRARPQLPAGGAGCGGRIDALLADRFYTAMQESALYLDLVARELAQADAIEPEQIIARVADNPANLFSLSLERLQRNERQWHGRSAAWPQ